MRHDTKAALTHASQCSSVGPNCLPRPRDWSYSKQSFTEHWDRDRLYPLQYTTMRGLLDKMLACRNLKIGYIAYRCLHFGQGQHRVAMRCQSAVLRA